MTLEQLQYFVVSAESGSFSSAAEQLYVSHSSVSRGVSALERELGTPLLVRGKRQLQCTPASGQRYAPAGGSDEGQRSSVSTSIPSAASQYWCIYAAVLCVASRFSSVPPPS